MQEIITERSKVTRSNNFRTHLKQFSEIDPHFGALAAITNDASDECNILDESLV
jgi:hypothetical protein